MQTKSMTALQLGQMIKKKEVSVKEAVQESLAQIADLDDQTRFFCIYSSFILYFLLLNDDEYEI